MVRLNSLLAEDLLLDPEHLFLGACFMMLLEPYIKMFSFYCVLIQNILLSREKYIQEETCWKETEIVKHLYFFLYAFIYFVVKYLFLNIPLFLPLSVFVTHISWFAFNICHIVAYWQLLNKNTLCINWINWILLEV